MYIGPKLDALKMLTNWRLLRWLCSQKSFLLLQRTQFPAPRAGGFQPPVALTLGPPVTSFGPHRHIHTSDTHRGKHTCAWGDQCQKLTVIRASPMRWRACIELSTLGMYLFSNVNKFDIPLELNIKFENSDILYIDIYKSFLFTVIRK